MLNVVSCYCHRRGVSPGSNPVVSLRELMRTLIIIDVEHERGPLDTPMTYLLPDTWPCQWSATH
jgi:hypothetical protein